MGRCMADGNWSTSFQHIGCNTGGRFSRVCRRISQLPTLAFSSRLTNRRRLWPNDGSSVRLRPSHRDEVWISTIRMLTLIDEHTRECLAVYIAHQLIG